MLLNRIQLLSRSENHWLCRYFSSTFNINDIVKQNKQKTTSSSKKKETKLKSSNKSNEISTEENNTDIITDLQTVATTNVGNKVYTPDSNNNAQFSKKAINHPECFTCILDMSVYANANIDTCKLQEFKDIIEDLEIGYLPSVSTIITATQSKKQQEVLKNWQLEKTKELGGDAQFQEFKKGMLNTGESLHKCIEMRLKGVEDITPSENCEGHWQSVQHMLGDIKDVKMLETDCVHQEIFYKGKFDCIAKLGNTMCLIEWKTSSKPKPLLSSTYDNPLQVAAYIGAVNRSSLLKQHDLTEVTHGALVIAYPSGEPATVHVMSQRIVEKYWSQWTQRVYMYWCQRMNHREPE
ncbi:hypothetical protein DPMN_101954 [Dreissena polymorpha]|uniref:Mitochondrial genome maintenance exonuclease 1 n=2 Tax=Dreissena polymorpha TaxID=45954 RepID=A0A9D4LIL6_DREPO|nr:hypothetical protein DPMN_101954 [Dreissena polymorpha]